MEKLYEVNWIRRFRDTNYGATKSGKIYNYNTGKYLNGHIAKNGYIRVKLGRNGGDFPVHRIVAECWISIPPELRNSSTLQIDHINCIRTDNRVLNLRWVDATMNRNNPKTAIKFYKPVAAYYKDGRLFKKYESMSSTEEDGFCRNCVYKAINKVGKTKYHKGFVWKYVN